jgi:hypothetical protein
MVLISSENHAKAKQLLAYIQREFHFVPELTKKLVEVDKLLHPATDDPTTPQEST